jgi:hypothetical protein
LVPGGPDNPLGARALYIGDTEFRIHGTTEPWSIGQAVSSGCIRMMNEEVIDLYDRVQVARRWWSKSEAPGALRKNTCKTPALNPPLT